MSNEDELCLLDSGITSLHEVPITNRLLSLNLHCNQLRVIEGLEHLRLLKHLDLSSNQISHVTGLQGLHSLRTLNLACNLIEVVEGLENLRFLVKINLSYNQIEDLTGFLAFHQNESCLSQIEIHGNKIQNIQHVVSCLKGCINLKQLSLAHSGATNPVCNKPDYRAAMLTSLGNLQVLDGFDRSGQPTPSDDILADIPGLEDYVDYLISSNSSDFNPIALATPRIDTALELFRHRGATTPELSTSMAGTITTDHDTSYLSHGDSPVRHRKVERIPLSDQEERIKKLESQLAELLKTDQKKTPDGSFSQRPKSATPRSRTKVQRHIPKRDFDNTDESESEATGSERSRSSKTSNKLRLQGSASRVTPRTKSNMTPSSSGRLQGQGATSSPGAARVKGQEVTATRSAADDIQLRDDLKSTYVQLMGELETERERRWKAEQASKKLVGHIKSLQEKATEDNDLQDVALQATSRLKQALTGEREATLRLQAEITVLKEELESTQGKLEEQTKTEDESYKALREAETTLARREREHAQQEAHMGKQVQEAQARAAAFKREVEILNSQVKTTKGQLRQLQELLATKEQEHRKELSERHRVSSPEMQDIVRNEVGKVERLHTEELRVQQQRIDNLTKQYGELEDEFRMALQIESDRFSELQDAFQKVSEDHATNKQALLLADQKYNKANNLVKELTSMVKEQKGRIAELSKSKQEQVQEYKERLETQEVHLQEARRRMVALEMLKQEKVKTSSQLQAQESMIEGLRAERKLWEGELAQQGVSLAQDRGRLEAKIEALTAEVSTVKKQLEREADSVKIKSKLIDDQTDTIRRLKEGLHERDNEIKKARDSALLTQKEAEEQIAAEMSTCQDLQDRLDHTRERKDELKSQIADLEESLNNEKHAHSMLNAKWREKSSLIGRLEKEVTEMKKQWESKEQKLTKEKDQAIEAASLAVNKLKAMDDSFRKQLDAKEVAHQRALEFLEAEKQEEIDFANKRVLEVEEEMRHLLVEASENKRAMEQRFKKLGSAFSELQNDLL